MPGEEQGKRMVVAGAGAGEKSGIGASIGLRRRKTSCDSDTASAWFVSVG